MNTPVRLAVISIIVISSVIGAAYGLSMSRSLGNNHSPVSSSTVSASDVFYPPNSTSVLIFQPIPSMSLTTNVKGQVMVQLFANCAVKVTTGGYGVLLWVRLVVDGIPTGDPLNPQYPGVHNLCSLTSGGYIVTEGYQATAWTINGLSGAHTFTIEASLVGFSHGVLIGPGPGTNGDIEQRTMTITSI